MKIMRLTGRAKRHIRVRKKVRGTASRPRLSVFRSARHIYAQVIDDTTGRTLATASTLEPARRKQRTKPLESAKNIGKSVAEKAKKAGIEEVVFDRGGYRYHGRVASVAEGAREAGLKF